MLISDFEYYDVTQDGKVINLRTGRILKPDLIWDGYERVTLSQNGKLKRFRVHRLVADAFIPNPFNLPFVNHIDGNKRNNKIDNLEWVSCKDNTIHAFDNGLRPSSENHYSAKLTENQVKQICELIELGLTRGRILNKFPFVTKSQFDDIRSRKSWKKVSQEYSWQKVQRLGENRTLK